ncbi:SDR family oxidoreductase [Streptomyces sp. SCSIO 30461]|uniref:SDR family oxidoreductase n=1 Tax=Streptomyces sp. SCSIO 30461 TaxID=3118085 RepID=UPI0030D58DF8
MILVTGATGTVGREVMRQLPVGASVRVLARDPSRVVGAAPGAEIVRGDYGNPAALERAMRGVRSAFLVTNEVGGDQDARFVDVAVTAGVGHVVKLSAAAVEDVLADDLITGWQRDAEELLRVSGMGWTLLRPRSFMSNSLSWAPSLRSERVVRALYGESVNACVDPRDIADVAVRALTEPGHQGRAYTLTGPQAVSAVWQTDRLAELLGRPVRFEELAPDQARVLWSRRHPAPVVEALLHSARRQREGAKAGVVRTVAELTGRPASSFETWARDHLTAFAGG